MKTLLILATLCAAASAYKFEHDIKIPVYDVFKSLYAAAPLSAYLDRFAKDGWLKFTDSFFHFYPENEIHDFFVVYKPDGEDFLHGYYMRTEDVSKYGSEFFDTVRPIYNYLDKGEYYAFTPYAAEKIAPKYYNTALKKIFYEYYKDVDVNREIPLVFLVPKSEVSEEALKDYIVIADYEITKPGAHTVHSYFGKKEARAAAAYYYQTAIDYPVNYYRSAVDYPVNYYRSAVDYPVNYGYNPYYYSSFYKGYPYYPYI